MKLIAIIIQLLVISNVAAVTLSDIPIRRCGQFANNVAKIALTAQPDMLREIWLSTNPIEYQFINLTFNFVAQHQLRGEQGAQGIANAECLKANRDESI